MTSQLFIRNKEKTIKIHKSKRKRDRRRNVLKDIIKDTFKIECCKCGESDIKCLTFHHRKKKIDTISSLLYKAVNIRKFKAELKKCIILCSNCHLIEHSINLNFAILKNKREIKKKALDKIKKKEYIFNYKKKEGCKICGNKNSNCLTFHHIDPNNKNGKINKLINKGWKGLKSEIEKCMVLCANCHIKLHKGLF
jgi:hypothetical protein